MAKPTFNKIPSLQEIEARFTQIGREIPTIGEEGDVESLEQAYQWLLNGEEEFEREREQAEADAAAREEADRALVLHQESCEQVVAALGGPGRFDRLGDPYSASSYFLFRGVKIRVSDHAQPTEGGYRVIEFADGSTAEGRFGGADVCFRDGRIPSRAEIRQAVADAIRAERE